MKHVVIGLIIKKNPRAILLISSKKDFGKYTGFYYPPGGHVEENETEVEALERELKEELRVKVITSEKITDTFGDVMDQHTAWYVCTLEQDEFIMDNEELQDAGYFTEQQCKRMNLWPTTKEILEKYFFETK